MSKTLQLLEIARRAGDLYCPKCDKVASAGEIHDQADNRPCGCGPTGRHRKACKMAAKPKKNGGVRKVPTKRRVAKARKQAATPRTPRKATLRTSSAAGPLQALLSALEAPELKDAVVHLERSQVDGRPGWKLEVHLEA